MYGILVDWLETSKLTFVVANGVRFDREIVKSKELPFPIHYVSN